jgi:hypothetical protein
VASPKWTAGLKWLADGLVWFLYLSHLHLSSFAISKSVLILPTFEFVTAV